MPISRYLSKLGTFLSSDGKVPTRALGSGAVLQVVQAVKTDTASTASTIFSDVIGLTAAITPSSAANNILRNGTNIAQPDSGAHKSTINHYPGGGTSAIGDSVVWLDSPSTTSTVTYKVQWRIDAGTGYLNRHVGGVDYNSVSSITVMEIAG
jgi:hypothetical protein